MPDGIAYNVKCPECDAVIPIPSDAQIDELISCGACGCADYIVTGIKNGKPEVKYHQHVGEDWGE
jgi:ribosomal protein S27E